VLTPESERRVERQVRAILNVMGPLDTRETVAVTATVAQCTADLRRNHPELASAVSPEDLALFAAYNAASLASPASAIRPSPQLTLIASTPTSIPRPR
jgi:hypothetical protein